MSAGAPVFKVGDRVRCIDSPNATWGNVWKPVLGKVYEVVGLSNQGEGGAPLVSVGSELEVTPSRAWLASRFELVESAPAPEEWTPGEGWREVPSENSARDDTEYQAHWTGSRWTYWVPEDPAPTLPIVPGTVIEVHSVKDPELDVTAWFLTPNGDWAPIGVHAAMLTFGLRVEHVTKVRVISEPRAITARTVLDQVEARGHAGAWHTTLIHVVRELEAAS